ncbi:MAG: hypothetical protein MUC69_01600 [Gemmatimonadales bacterium]|jgi:hypothetical protein|nr:hypothetical protein [Gemmatimonadales bacterium]
MRVVEPWVAAPLEAFLEESSARLTLLMTAEGQVIAQDGFLRSVDVMAASALGAGIIASLDALAALMGTTRFRAVLHQGSRQSLYLNAFDTPRGRWIGLVVFGGETSVGLVQLFFQDLAERLAAATPPEEAPRAPLAASFEQELNASLRSLFGR